MLARGLTRRCPRCGGGGLFTGWFKMRAQCPGCGHRFEREEGFFLGAYVVNLAIVEVLIVAVTIVPYIWRLSNDPRTSATPYLVAGLIATVVAPLAFYPFSRTTWAAIELIFRPADESEPTDTP